MYRKSKSINIKKIYIRVTYFMLYLVKVSPIARVASKIWVRTALRWGVVYITLCDNKKQLATGRWFSPVSSTNKTDHHDITEIVL
jgi:hypothetical protein